MSRYQKHENILKKYNYVVPYLILIVAIAGLTGFKLNPLDIISFYTNLEIDGKIGFMFALNLLATAFAFIYLLRKMSKNNENPLT